jgi:hypothetical protein
MGLGFRWDGNRWNIASEPASVVLAGDTFAMTATRAYRSPPFPDAAAAGTCAQFGHRALSRSPLMCQPVGLRRIC